MNPFKPLLTTSNLFILAGLASLNVLLCYLVLILNVQTLYVENSWLENIQAVMLYIACVVFFISACRLQGKHRILCLFFSMLCFIFAFRELDVDKFDVPQWLIFLLAEQGRALFFAVAILLLAWVAKDTRFFWRYRTHYLSSNFFFYMALSALLLLIFSHAFDRKWVIVEHQVFYEELSEISAYYALLIAAFIARRDFTAIECRISQS